MFNVLQVAQLCENKQSYLVRAFIMLLSNNIHWQFVNKSVVVLFVVWFELVICTRIPKFITRFQIRVNDTRFSLITDGIKAMKPIYSWMTMSNCLNEHFLLRPGYDSYFRWRTYTQLHIWHRKHIKDILYEKT